MSKLNKIVTNYPITLTPEEVANLSETLSAVRTAGGGEGGQIYIAGDSYINVNNEHYRISLTEKATELLERDIPSAVSQLSDSASYAKVEDLSNYQPIGDYLSANALDNLSGTWENVTAKLDKDEFAEVSGNFLTQASLNGYATEAELENYQTKGDYLSGNALDNVSGTWNTVTQKLDSTAFSTVSSDFLTETSLNGYATETYVQTASAGITGWVNEQGYLTKPSGDLYYTPLPNGLSDDQYYAMTNSGWKVIQGGGGQGGISTVAHDGSLSGNGNSENLGIKTDAALNLTNASAKSANSAYWAVKAKTNDGQQEYTIGTELASLNTLTQDLDSWAETITGDQGVEVLDTNEDGYPEKIQLTQTAYNAITSVSSKLDITAAAQTYQIKGDYYSASNPNKYVNESYITSLLAGYAEWEDFENLSADVQNKLYASAAAQTYLDKTTYATDSATFVTSSSNTITGTKQYALTTAGWTEVSTPTIPDITANNGLSANGHTIGIDNTNLVADTQYAWTTTGWNEVSTPTIPAITAESGISADGYKIGLTTTAIDAITSVSSKVDKPDTTQAALNDKYLIYSTLSGEGQPTGWVDMQAKVYSKTEADGTFVATANIDTTTLSGDGKSVSTKLGVKTDVIATRDYVNSSFLPTSGGTVSGSTYFSAASGQNLIAVASAASLIGASRQTSGNFGQNNDAMGTTWMGVGGPGMYRGFLKYTQGGNVGALDSNNTMQVEFTPNDKGTIFAKAKNNGTDCPETQIINATTASVNNMSTSGVDANNMSGPNYMIAKNADGQFVIGAAVFNCQGSLPGTLQPNTYYFVY